MAIMGIVNCTPDSFSDGGLNESPSIATETCLSLVSRGVDWVDLGAESSRPGATPLSSEQEWDRLLPVLSSLQSRGFAFEKLSIDSYHPQTMVKAAQMGVGMINCIKGVVDEDVLLTLKKANPQVKYAAMHMYLDPKQMHRNPLKKQPAVTAVEEFFRSSHKTLTRVGFAQEDIFLDPGIGFGKNDAANLALMAKAGTWAKSYNLLYGVSRKSFFGRLLGIDQAQDRDPVSKVTEVGLWLSGVQIIRTHAVDPLLAVKRVLKEDS